MLLIWLSALPLAPGLRRDAWIVWNVGQGSWVTFVEGGACRHVDAGGERWPLRALRQRCGDRRQEIFLSHWDLDHVGGVKSLRRLWPDSCLGAAPGGRTASPRKLALLRGLPSCPSPAPELNEIHWSVKSPSPNARSRVWVWRDRLILPGDSPRAEEERWAGALPRRHRLRLLLLGHHGSRTSSSDFLLRRLPGLRLALVSSRQARFGHPHREVIQRLRQRKIPILRTEEWGHLVFEI
ncbi:MAG: hydrolase [Bdellovibrionaceae bacterium]|nr:hydrolase [Pseudobdellovibrionaceae bacterium]